MSDETTSTGKETIEQDGAETVQGSDRVAVDTGEKGKGVIEALKEQNKILQKNLERAERLQAERLVSGRSDGGQKSRPRELTPTEYKDLVMSGVVP